MSNVKFTRETLLNQRYEGSKETIWWNETASKRLGRVYAKQDGYGWSIFNENHDRVVRLGMYSKKKDAAEYLANYDEMMDQKEAEEKAQQEAELARSQKIQERIKSLTESFKTPAKSEVPEAGSMIQVLTPNMNKNCSMGEYLFQLENDYTEFYPEDKGREYITKELARVHGVVELSNEEYDDYLTSLMEGKEFFQRDQDGIIGGHMSEDPRLEGHEFPAIYNNPELKEIWFNTMFAVVHAITAPNRKTFFVNTEGYQYARYVSFAA